MSSNSDLFVVFVAVLLCCVLCCTKSAMNDAKQRASDDKTFGIYSEQTKHRYVKKPREEAARDKEMHLRFFLNHTEDI